MPVPAWVHAWLLVPAASLGLFMFWTALTAAATRAFPGAWRSAFFPTPAQLLLALPLLLVAHELLHALCHPGWGLSSRTTLGVWPARGFFYAHYAGTLTRERLVVVALAPLLALSAAPLATWALFHAQLSPATASDLLIWAVVHSALCGGDLLSVAFLAAFIPAGALIQSKGDRAYWRPRADHGI